MYSHQNCLSNKRPGKIIAIFVANPHASTVLTRFQYFLELIVLIALNTLFDIYNSLTSVNTKLLDIHLSDEYGTLPP